MGTLISAENHLGGGGVVPGKKETRWFQTESQDSECKLDSLKPREQAQQTLWRTKQSLMSQAKDRE